MELISIYGWMNSGRDPGGGRHLRIGSLTSFSHITQDPLIQKYLNVLGEAVDQVGGPRSATSAPSAATPATV